MPFTRKSAPGKKQTPMPGPTSAAYKKIVADRKEAALKSSTSKPANKKSLSPSPAFSTLKARQRIIDRVKRAIWAKVLEINDAIINLALAGNFNAAKALFDFAGVYTLPTSGDSNSPAVAAAAPPAAEIPSEAAPINPVDAFFRRLGIEPPCDEPEPDMAV